MATRESNKAFLERMGRAGDAGFAHDAEAIRRFAPDARKRIAMEAERAKAFMASPPPPPQAMPKWVTVEGIEVLRIGSSPFVAMPSTGRRSSANFQIFDLRDRSAVVAFLKKGEVTDWLLTRARAGAD